MSIVSKYNLFKSYKIYLFVGTQRIKLAYSYFATPQAAAIISTRSISVPTGQFQRFLDVVFKVLQNVLSLVTWSCCLDYWPIPVVLSNDRLHEFTLNWVLFVPQLFGFGTATVFCVQITLLSYLLTDTVTSQTWIPPSLQGIHVITFSSRCPLSLMLVDVCPLNQRNILLENTIKEQNKYWGSLSHSVVWKENANDRF